MSRRIFLPMFVVAIAFVTIVTFGGASVSVFFDIASLCIVPLAPLVFMLLSYGGKGVVVAYKVPFKRDATVTELSMSVSFFRSFSAAIWSFGALGSATGFITMLVYLTDKTKIGPNAAVALITILYAAFFNLVLVLPFLSSVRQRLAGMDY